MGNIDLFISYEHESKIIADNICSVLESKGIRCWYAPRDVRGDYATSIVEAIEHCKVFVLVLNPAASESPHVLNEVEMAYQRILKGEITIVPFKVENGVFSKAMEYYVKRLHWIDAASDSLDKAILELYEKLIPVLGIERVTNNENNNDENHETNLKRKVNQYYSADNLVEVKRLFGEEAFLYDIERPYYDRLFYNKEKAVVLDFNVLCPYHAVKKFADRTEVSKVAYLTYSEPSVLEGNEMLKQNGDNENKKFFLFDQSTTKVEEALPKILNELNATGFDFLNLTMSIMDFGNPFKILNKIKKFLNPGAVAFIRDVDDGVVFAYPDEKGLFKEVQNFYKYDTLSGSRESGRQIYDLMKKLGAIDVRLERCGINTTGMDYHRKHLVFESWFGFIPNDFKIMLERDPQDKIAKKIIEWLDEHYDDLEEQFSQPNFIFNSGYVIYTVRF